MRIGIGFEEESTKFLGVISDELLTWKQHINYINNKISKSLFAIKQVIMNFRLIVFNQK